MLGAYSVSKTALLGLTKVVANDLAENNIRVNCVAPGIIKTKFASAVSFFCCESKHFLSFLFYTKILFII